MPSIASTAMLYVLGVSITKIRPLGFQAHDSSSIDTQTAIFVETTSHMIGADVLHERHPFGGPGKPEDIAKMAVVLASEDASWVTGINLPVDGGYTAR